MFEAMRKKERGSVLLIVVVLLVLLAIMGTAYLATARYQTITSGYAASNTQINVMTDSAEKLAKSYIVQALFSNIAAANSPAAFRSIDPVLPAYNDPQYVIPDYGGYVSVPTNDIYLADRLPIDERDYPAIFPSAAASPTPVPAWAAITGPLMPNANGQYQFESPDGTATPTQGTTVNAWMPTSKVIGTVAYPALEPVIGGTPEPASTFIAADADGDGIADAGLIRIPGASSDGLTYYMAFRIIDNNSAINVNTAWDMTQDDDFTPPTGTPPAYNAIAPTNTTDYFPLGTFPSQVGLLQVLDQSTATPGENSDDFTSSIARLNRRNCLYDSRVFDLRSTGSNHDLCFRQQKRTDRQGACRCGGGEDGRRSARLRGHSLCAAPGRLAPLATTEPHAAVAGHQESHRLRTNLLPACEPNANYLLLDSRAHERGLPDAEYLGPRRSTQRARLFLDTRWRTCHGVEQRRSV